MKKKILSFSILIVAILFVIFFWQLKSPAIAPIENDLSKQTPNLEISFQFDKSETFSLQYPYQNSENLLEITKKIATEQLWDFDSEFYPEMGALITQIRDKTNGQDNKYWQYQVNEKTPLISADNFFPQAADKIEWKFENSAM